MYHSDAGFQPFKSFSTNNANRSQRRLDATNVAMFADQLKYVSPTVHDQIKSNLVLFNLFPIEPIPAGANYYEYQMFDTTGVGTYTANKASDIPLVNRVGSQYTSPMGTLDIAMEVSEGDIEAALFSGSNHVQKLRDQCIRGLYETMEDTLLKGYTPLGLKGLMNYDAGNTAVANNWYTGTAEQIYDDVASAYEVISNQTSGNIVPDTMLISSTLYTVLQKKPNKIGDTYTGTNVLDMITSSLTINVVKVPKLNKAFENKTKDGFYLLANKPQYLVQPMAIMFDSTEPQRNGWVYKTFCRSKHGALVVLHPKTMIARKMTAAPA